LQHENDDKATSHLGGVVKRLAQIKRVPQNIVRTMMQIMQTTSFPKFNNKFELMETSKFVNDCESNLHVGVTGQLISTQSSLLLNKSMHPRGRKISMLELLDSSMSTQYSILLNKSMHP
jgi:hypothetical protein